MWHVGCAAVGSVPGLEGLGVQGFGRVVSELAPCLAVQNSYNVGGQSVVCFTGSIRSIGSKRSEHTRLCTNLKLRTRAASSPQLPEWTVQPNKRYFNNNNFSINYVYGTSGNAPGISSCPPDSSSTNFT